MREHTYFWQKNAPCVAFAAEPLFASMLLLTWRKLRVRPERLPGNDLLGEG